MLGNIGPTELIIVLALALIILGPKRLPEVGRSLGTGLREFKASVSSIGHDHHEDDDEETLAGDTHQRSVRSPKRETPSLARPAGGTVSADEPVRVAE